MGAVDRSTDVQVGGARVRAARRPALYADHLRARPMRATPAAAEQRLRHLPWFIGELLRLALLAAAIVGFSVFVIGYR